MHPSIATTTNVVHIQKKSPIFFYDFEKPVFFD